MEQDKKEKDFRELFDLTNEKDPAIINLANYVLSTGSKAAERQLKIILEQRANQERLYKLENPYHVVFPEEMVAGGFFICYAKDGEEIFIPMSGDKTENLSSILVGQPGTGKTTQVVCNIVRNLESNQNELIYWVFTRKKDQEYNKLLEYGFWSFDTENFKDNILEPPPGKDKFEWASEISELIAFEGQILPGGESFLKNILEHLYNKNKPFPIMKDLEKYLYYKVNYSTTRKNYEEPLFYRINKISADKELGSINNCVQGYDFEKIANHCCVFDCSPLSTLSYNIFAGSLAKKLEFYKYPLDKKKTHILIYEDSHELFNLNKEIIREQLIMPTFAKIITQCRSLKIAVWGISHQPSLTSQFLISSSNISICFGVSHGYDKEAVAKNLFLDEEQLKYYANIPDFEAVCKISSIKCGPFLAKTKRL